MKYLGPAWDKIESIVQDNNLYNISIFLFNMAQKQSVPFETLAKDDNFHGREEKGDYVIKDAQTLANLYSEMYPPCPIPEEKPKPPQIDFDKQMVIAVFQGECSSGGYDIEIKSLTRNNKGLEVLVRETRPSGEMMLTMVMTYPAHVIKTERYDGDVNFQRQ